MSIQTGSRPPRAYALPRSHSAPSPSPNPDEREALSTPVLANICDDIRATIRSYQGPGSLPHFSELCSLLSAFLSDENNPSTRISLDTIRECRLDRLLDDILDRGHLPPRGDAPQDLDRLSGIARRLQRRWAERFGADYFALDERRREELLSTGKLEGLYFSMEKRPAWRVSKHGSADVQSEPELGQFFLSMACAYRKGLEGDSAENLCVNGTRVLALLWGREESIHPGTTRYSREGTIREMAHSLISHVGQRLHIIRGYKLRSPFSPAVGLRHDGVYFLRSYALKLDPRTELYRLTLTAERARRQVPLETLLSVPKPADIDDWLLCERIEEREMRRAGRAQEFPAWKHEKGRRVLF